MHVQWAYLRKGWTSCKNAQEVLETTKVSFEEIVDARKVRFDEKAAWEIVKEAKTITIAKGKKVTTWDPKVDKPELILKQVMGPSGNLRAPTYRVSDRIIIGFNPELYQAWLKENWNIIAMISDFNQNSCASSETSIVKWNNLDPCKL